MSDRLAEPRVAKRLLSAVTANSWIGTLWHPSSGCQRSIADIRGWSLRDDPRLLKNMTGTDSAIPIRRPSPTGWRPWLAWPIWRYRLAAFPAAAPDRAAGGFSRNFGICEEFSGHPGAGNYNREW